MSATIREALQDAIRCLTHTGSPEPRAAAEALLADLLALPRWQLHLENHRALSTSQRSCYTERIERRQRGEPVQYIIGRQEFWSLEFEVNPDVLIPRPESELLVELGARLVRQWCAAQPHEVLHLLDVGTGSGNLAASLASELPRSHIWGIDGSLAALRVAKRNAQRLGVASKLTWLCGDLVTPLQDGLRRFALCVSNLPYVTTAEWQQLPQEVRMYEPPGALLGGCDGLTLIRRFIVLSPMLLASGGSLLLEVGWKQAGAVLDILHQTGAFERTEVYRDFAGIERVVHAQVA